MCCLWICSQNPQSLFIDPTPNQNYSNIHLVHSYLVVVKGPTRVSPEYNMWSCCTLCVSSVDSSFSQVQFWYTIVVLTARVTMSMSWEKFDYQSDSQLRVGRRPTSVFSGSARIRSHIGLSYGIRKIQKLFICKTRAYTRL